MGERKRSLVEQSVLTSCYTFGIKTLIPPALLAVGG